MERLPQRAPLDQLLTLTSEIVTGWVAGACADREE